jgi:hypothetical protein
MEHCCMGSDAAVGTRFSYTGMLHVSCRLVIFLVCRVMDGRQRHPRHQPQGRTPTAHCLARTPARHQASSVACCKFYCTLMFASQCLFSATKYVVSTGLPWRAAGHAQLE